MTRNQAGFTLIELLIVILILGVLSGIVVFAVGAFNSDGKVAACQSDKKNVEVAEEAWYAKHTPNAYTTNLQDLVDKQYLRELPTDVTVAVAGNVLTVSGTVAGC